MVSCSTPAAAVSAGRITNDYLYNKRSKNLLKHEQFYFKMCKITKFGQIYGINVKNSKYTATHKFCEFSQKYTKYENEVGLIL